ncbi:class I SAM-dependent methyltransferase [Nocardioides currus]|uniref:class I SAM-dependent methyltransferase n=1 Tax=Nocardioides currus TaxID=2133958 RepID=UPI001A9C67FD|nr:class I SAM-dependent methyltransferase [Nocardioides currus]
MPRQPIEPPAEADPTARTVASYELVAADYARETAGGGLSDGLARLVEAVPGGHVLEIGSGPGWDADALEEAGLRVRRTDVTQAFIDLQQERGQQVERLDVVSDDLGGPYDAVVALAVLQHVPRSALARVLGRMAASLAPGGALLLAVRTGEGERWEVGDSGNPYYVALWEEGELIDLLVAAGLRVEWQEVSSDSEDSDWVSLLARIT